MAASSIRTDRTIIPNRTKTIATLISYLDQQQVDDAVDMLTVFTSS